MSEYQYYEFQAVDRPLTIREQEKISDLSSRVQLTAASAIFTYSYGDFRGDPAAVLAQYFDAMFYLANWGTTRLMFRFPRKLVPLPELISYCDGEMVSVEEKGEHLILDIRLDDEPTGWIEGDGILRRLLPLRQQILERDYRMLYLAWLNSLEGTDDSDQTALEPTVPANLAALSPELKVFVELFEIDPDLISIAAEASPAIKENGLDYAAWIPKLSATERDQDLARLAGGEPNLAAEFRQRLRDLSGAQFIRPSGRRRSIVFLLSEAERRKAKREKEKRTAAERARLEHLDRLAKQEVQLWDQTRSLIEQKQSKSYDAAVVILRDLHALACHRTHVFVRVQRATLRATAIRAGSFHPRKQLKPQMETDSLAF